VKVIFKNGREGLSVGPSLLEFSLAHHECGPLMNLTMLTLPHGREQDLSAVLRQRPPAPVEPGRAGHQRHGAR